METFRSCPTCLEIPELEIYQCSSGHIICDLCIAKVSLCPDCKIRYGATKIRSKILEDILETQNFECKFKNQGCKQFTKRGKITRHANSCWFNPNTISLCSAMEFQGCRFKLGCVSKAKVISHLREVHEFRFRLNLSMTFSIPWNFFMEKSNRKRKLAAAAPNAGIRPLFAFLISQDSSETSPLFLVYGKLNIGTGFVSFVCVKVWESPSYISYFNTVTFTLNKDNGLLPSNTPEQSSTRPLTGIGINLFPMCMSMKVCSVREAVSIMKASPVNIPISLLEDTRFGADTGDHLKVEISRGS